MRHTLLALRAACLAFTLFIVVPPSAAADNNNLPWSAFTPALQKQAATEGKPIFLYLEAVWCHWCHVMQQKTFTDPAVIQLLKQDWILARANHDANPLLANAYRDYGWPALIFFSAHGAEISKNAGFIGPVEFVELLQALKSEAQTLPAKKSVVTKNYNPRISKDVKNTLISRHKSAYDPIQGSLKLPQKFLDADSVEYALYLAANGDVQEGDRVLQTLDAAAQLIDPVWGGMYQYSTHGDWQHPHFEKIMRSQARALTLYSLAYAQGERTIDLQRAQSIKTYLFQFLKTPSGAFNPTQDADLNPGEKAAEYFALNDAERRKRGIPAVANAIYAQENGMAITGLATLAELGKDPSALEAAIRAAQAIMHSHQGPNGSFLHGADNSHLYLGDNLHMALGFMALYKASKDPIWLKHAETTADAISKIFAQPTAGFTTADPTTAVLAPPVITEENIVTARLFIALAKTTHKSKYLAEADRALAWLNQSSVALETLTEPGILLANIEREKLK